MHVHYYQIAYCYYQLGLQDEMFTYLVRGAIFSSELLKMEGQNNSPFSQGVQFLEQAKDVFTKIENGEINPMKYLQS